MSSSSPSHIPASATPPSWLPSLREARHDRPHDVLGLHQEGRSQVLRVFDPEATAVHLGDQPLQDLGDGLFQISLGKGAAAPFELSFSYAGGKITRHDPYSLTSSLGELDLHLINQGDHRELYNALGARLVRHHGVDGVRFTLWAPNAAAVSVIGDFNTWGANRHPMRRLDGSLGLWELFIPGLGAQERYKFSILTRHGARIEKQDPLALLQELRPATSSITWRSSHRWADADWLQSRAASDVLRRPMSIYEIHLGSWRHPALSQQREFSNYREIAPVLAAYMQDMGFTHVELLPITEHPYDPSWGYQTTGYFAPTSRFGDPDDFAWFVDHLHQHGLGVIIDWVPAHFPMDAHALGRFDGTALYEHDNDEEGYHPDWNTFIFNYGRAEVANFLLASALFWLDRFHIDGLRVDAVASMLYRDYSREQGRWRPNRDGGRENYEAIDFMRRLNTLCHAAYPGCAIIAEESTAFAKVSRPVYDGGLGFTMKWNMGWMHDTLKYFAIDPVFRKYHHNQITFSMVYAFNENFILPLSHDEVVHGKGSLIERMPGDSWQKFANLRLLYAYMYAHPGKKLLFMGAELAQWHEWSAERSLDWATLCNDRHAGIQQLVRQLNHTYKAQAQLWEQDCESAGFSWLDMGDHEQSVLSFIRYSRAGRPLLCILNLTPVVRHGYRIGSPTQGEWQVILNTDDHAFGGAGAVSGQGRIRAENVGTHGRSHSLRLDLPPLAALWLSPG